MGKLSKEEIRTLVTRWLDCLDEYQIQASKDNFLEKHSGMFDGHVLSDRDLRERILDAKKVGKKIDATCFTISRKEIVELVKESICKEMVGIIDWIMDGLDERDFAITYEPGKVIGKGFHSKWYHVWNAGACPCSQVRVILRKQTDRPGFKVLTAYPVASRNEVEEMMRASYEYEQAHPRKTKRAK